MIRFYTLRAGSCEISCSLSEFSKQLTKHLLSGKHLSCVTTKPVFGASDQVQQKVGCTTTEDG